MSGFASIGGIGGGAGGAAQTPWLSDIDAASFNLNNAGIILASLILIANLPTADPGAGSKALWYDTAAGNTVKYSP